MNKHFSKVQEILKPKFAPFGFNDDDLKGVIESIADNFKEDEELDEAKVNAQGDAVIPALKAAQSNANRVINAKIEEYKKQKPQQPNQDPKQQPANQGSPQGQEEMPAWAKTLQEQNQSLLQQVAALQAEKSGQERLSKYEEIIVPLKDKMPKQYEKLQKDFGRFNFKDEDDFNLFLNTEKETIKGLVQELTDKGLITTPPQGGSGDGNEKDLLLEQINTGTQELKDAKKD